MANKGKNKVPHTPQEICELAEEFEEVGKGLRGYAKKMAEIGLPEFDFQKSKVANTHLFEIKLWLAGLRSEWEKQKMHFDKSKAIAARIAAGEAKRGRPPKKRPA